MEFINEPFVSYFVASDYVEVACIKKYGPLSRKRHCNRE